MKRYIREAAPAAAPVPAPAQAAPVPAAGQKPAPAAPAAGAAAPKKEAPAKLSASAQKLQTTLGKIKGLDTLMQNVTNRDDAAEILAAMATKLGGEKISASKVLTNALSIAKDTEKQINEQFAVENFLRYLFE